MNLYRTKTTVTGMRESFVDWFDATSEDDAREKWKLECEASGIKTENATVEIQQCDRETFKPCAS